MYRPYAIPVRISGAALDALRNDGAAAFTKALDAEMAYVMRRMEWDTTLNAHAPEFLFGDAYDAAVRYQLYVLAVHRGTVPVPQAIAAYCMTQEVIQ